MILTIAKREFKSLFISPLAWVILAVLQAVMAWIFLAQVDSFYEFQPQLIHLENTPGVTDLVIAPLYSLASIIFLMIMPLITMRSFAEEKRNQTLSLLLSSPAHIYQIVLGKYFALLTFVFIMAFLLMLMPLSLSIGTSLDFAKVCSGFIATFLLLATFSAIGLYLSSLTDNTTIAAVSTFGALLFLWIIDWVGDASGDGVLSYLSLIKHQQAMIDGLFNSTDILYYFILIALFLILNIQQLDSDRRLS